MPLLLPPWFLGIAAWKQRVGSTCFLQRVWQTLSGAGREVVGTYASLPQYT